MRNHRSTKDHDDQTSSNNESVSENSSNDDQEDEPEESEEDDDPESIDDEAVNDLHDLVFQQNQAAEKLSSKFQLLNISPIHDR